MDASRIDDLFSIAELVRDGAATTRSEIGTRLSLRSTSVSELVGELIERDVLREATLKTQGRGRPAAALSFNQHRLGAILISVIDACLVARAFDLGYRVIAESRAYPTRQADNAAIAEHIQTLVWDLAEKLPASVELSCVVLSLPGLLDAQRAVWSFSSRWPNLADLDLAAALAGSPWPVSLIRNLDAELIGARAHEHHAPEETSLLLHWGHGIGASCCVNGHVLNRERGRFCEIGHWQLGNEQARICNCGNKDCLETVAALWALGPQLHVMHPDIPTDETGLAAALAHLDIHRSPEIEYALSQVLRLTVNLCRLVFPDRITLTGPFTQNPTIFARFAQAIEEAPLLKSIDAPQISHTNLNGHYEMIGALRPQFEHELRRCLSG